MTNKARFSGQLSQALRNDMISNDQKKELEQAFHVIKQFKGDNYLHKATENHLAKKKKMKKEEPQPLPPTRSPSPFQLEDPSSPSLRKQIKLD